MTSKFLSGIKGTVVWIGIPMLIVTLLFIASLLFILVTTYLLYLPFLLVLLGIIGFIVGYTKSKELP